MTVAATDDSYSTPRGGDLFVGQVIDFQQQGTAASATVNGFAGGFNVGVSVAFNQQGTAATALPTGLSGSVEFGFESGAFPLQAIVSPQGNAGSLGVSATPTDGLLRIHPNWNDETAAYTLQGMTLTGALEDMQNSGASSGDKGRFESLSNITDTHNGTEGDDLATAVRMYLRLDGIRQPAADSWFARMESLLPFFRDNYQGQTAWNADLAQGTGFDHLYMDGLCDYYDLISPQAAIVSRVDAMIVEIAANYSALTPGDPIFAGTAWGRRWGRVMRGAVRAYEVSPIAANRTWRDKAIDVVMMAPNWDATYKMYWLNESSTDAELGAGRYQAGDRITKTFHMGIWMDALWIAWRALYQDGTTTPNGFVAVDVAQRLVDMATFYLDMPLNSGDNFFSLELGYETATGSGPADATPINSGYSGGGVRDGVENLPPICALVSAYKFTGNQSYLDKAWLLLKYWQTSADLGSTPFGSVHHYADSMLATGLNGNYLANNKGEWQYIYPLFENGGEPIFIEDAYEPSWYTGSAIERAFINLNTVAGSETFQQQEPKLVESGWTFGGTITGLADYHSAVFNNWNGYYVRPRFSAGKVLCGGHYGSAQNTCYDFQILREDPNWHSYFTDPDLFQMPSHGGNPNETITNWDANSNGGGTAFYTDGLPVPTHTYDHLTYIPDLVNGGGIVFRPWGRFKWAGSDSSAGATIEGVSYNFSKDGIGTYSGVGDYPDWDGEASVGGGAQYDENRDITWCVNTAGSSQGTFKRQIKYYDLKTNSYSSQLGQYNTSSSGDANGMGISPDHEVVIILQTASLTVVNTRPGFEGDAVDLTNHNGPLANQPGPAHFPIQYDKISQVFTSYDGGSTIYKMPIPNDYRDGDGTLSNTAQWTWSVATNLPGGVTPPSASGGGNIPIFAYFEQPRGYLCIPAWSADPFFYKCKTGVQ